MFVTKPAIEVIFPEFRSSSEEIDVRSLGTASLYLIIAVHRLVSVFRRHRTRNDSRFYIRASISGPALPCFGEFARAAEPITAKPFPYRKPEAKESHVARVCVRGRACVCICTYMCACMLVLTHGGTVPAGEEDIESDSRRTGHNFRPTRSELLMTSLPPPHHSRCRST